MKRLLLPLLLLVQLVDPCPAGERPVKMPWQVNRPIVTVKKELYRKRPSHGAAPCVDLGYVGPNLELLRIDSVMGSSDTLTVRSFRTSTDNGRTWSAPTVLPNGVVHYQGTAFSEGEGPWLYDEAAGVLVDTWMRQDRWSGSGLTSGSTSYWRLSRDSGKTWTTPKMLRYEPGDEFDPKTPQAPGYHKTNRGYYGNNIIKLSDGKLLTVLTDANSPDGSHNSSLCLIGEWNAEAKDYRWTPGNRVTISPKKSSRGLMEAEAAELTDGRVLVVWRGSNTPTTPGRKFFSVSRDGGITLSPVAEWKYDDGSSFYSPSAIHRMVRSSATGKLYWIGNICATPPNGNSPRYPLVIAEVDERGAVPALKKRTVTLIDDRKPDQPAGIQFSNFALLEDRETHALHLYMAVIGEDPSSVFNADNYKYIITMAQPNAALAQLQRKAASVLRTAMTESKSFEGIHAAEALLWSGQPTGIRERFLERDRVAGSESGYRIGVWRILYRSSAGNPAGQEKYLRKLVAVFEDPKAEDRGVAGETLGKLKYAARTKLVLDLAEHDTTELRVCARWILANGGNPEDESRLAELLQSADPDTRFYAAFTFRHFKAVRPATLESLRDLAAKEPRDGPVRCFVLGTLYTHLRSDQRGPVKNELLRYAADGTTDQRFQACMALANWPTEDMAPAMEKLLSNQPEDERIGGAYVLLRMGKEHDKVEPYH
jgi:hypothetical protein